MSVRILSFNAIHSVIKDIFHNGQLPIYGACQKWRILSALVKSQVTSRTSGY
jgi:hypothetical protein